MKSSNLLDQHLHALEACNQRGGRMLSLIDLIAAGTVNVPLAAYLATMMRRGASLLVGALPGGAGKTTIMCALLNFLPDDVAIRVLDGVPAIAAATGDDAIGATCYIAHEIGAGGYYAYVWNAAARAFLALAKRGHIIASNLHADTLEQTYAQLCDDLSVPRDHVCAIALKVYVAVQREHGKEPTRRVAAVYESTGRDDVLVWRHTPDGFERAASARLVGRREEDRMATFLSVLRDTGTRTIAAVRAALLRYDEVAGPAQPSR
jgi:hypothetical protein